MTAEEEKMMKIAELRAHMEKRVRDMEAELEKFQILLDFIDEQLLEKGFKRAEIAKYPPTPKAITPSLDKEYEKSIPLKTVTGDLLALIFLGEDSIRVILAEDKRFDVNTPPFKSFLLDRVLSKMQEKDREAVNKGIMTPYQKLSYNIVLDGDHIREITVRNITSERSQELKSAIRWTLEKMYEKMMLED